MLYLALRHTLSAIFTLVYARAYITGALTSLLFFGARYTTICDRECQKMEIRVISPSLCSS